MVPLVGAATGLVLSYASVRLEGSVGLPARWHYSPSTAGTVLSAVVAAMVGLVGFVVTISVLVVQMATGTFSPRYMRLWYRDGVLKTVLAWLIGTLTFSYSLLRRIGTESVPDLGVTLAGLFVSIGVVLFFVFLDRFIHRLRPVAVASLVARAGSRSTQDLATQTPPEIETALGAAERQVATIRSTGAGSLQAVHREGLVRWAAGHDCVLVLPHAVGDFVSRDTPLVQVHGRVQLDERDVRALRGMVALGIERTIEQDVAFAIRVIVDVAIRALSPAVNDPTTAVQMLDYLGETLQVLGRAEGLDGRLTLGDQEGRPRLVLPAPRWEDLLALGVTEIREYGAPAVQVLRRLRALLEELRESVRPEYVAAVERELERLDATVAASFGETVDVDLAGGSDRQGIGGAPEVRRIVPMG